MGGPWGWGGERRERRVAMGGYGGEDGGGCNGGGLCGDDGRDLSCKMSSHAVRG